MKTAEAEWAKVLIVVVLASMLRSMQGDTSPADVEGLRLFHISLESPFLSGWKSSGGDPCGEYWQGVTCTGSNVTKIELSGLKLNGNLGWSSSLDRFKHLTVLDLSNNELKGMIPNNLPSNIELLNLQNNHLTQNMPWSLGQLLFLTELRLAHNNLTGKVVDNFAKLHSLITLDISDNAFTGSVPTSLRNLSKLSFVYLQDNHLDSGLEYLATLRLQALDIRENAFQGEIPTQLMAIPSFQYSGNELNYSLPLSLSNVSFPYDLFNVSFPPGPAPFPEQDRTPKTAPVQSPSTTEGLPPSHYATAPFSNQSSGAQTIEEGNYRGNASFWSPWRIAGLSFAATLAIIAAVLTFLLLKWKNLEEEYEKADPEMSKFQFGDLHSCCPK